VVPTADYVRFATHYGFGPDFCEAADPESKGIVEALVGYAKRDLIAAAELQVGDLAAANQQAAEWCTEVNTAVHSEICAVPAERLEQERELLGPLPSLRPEIGAKPISRKVDKLSCVRFGSARYSVPNRLIGQSVLLLVLAETTGAGCRCSSRCPANSWPTTRWSRPGRPASSTSITAAPGRTSRAARREPAPPRRSGSSLSARSPNSSWSARPRPGWHMVVTCGSEVRSEVRRRAAGAVDHARNGFGDD
jgi:hypothetical protein